MDDREGDMIKRIKWPQSLIHHNKLDLLQLYFFLLVILISLLVWEVDFITKPLKLFTVFVHEICHALAVIITGGNLEDIMIKANESGYTRFRGGIYILVLSAGYIGSITTGALMLKYSADRIKTRGLALMLGTLFIGFALFILLRNQLSNHPFVFTYNHSFEVFFNENPANEGYNFLLSLLIGFSYGFLFFIIALFPVKTARYFIKLLAILSCLYAVMDLRNDLLSFEIPPITSECFPHFKPVCEHYNDAQLTVSYLGIGGYWGGVLSLIIGVIWSFISLIILYKIIKNIIVKKEENPSL